MIEVESVYDTKFQNNHPSPPLYLTILDIDAAYYPPYSLSLLLFTIQAQSAHYCPYPHHRRTICITFIVLIFLLPYQPVSPLNLHSSFFS